MSAEFHPPSRSLTPQDYQFLIFAVLLLSAVFYGLTQLNLRFKGGGEFYVHWVAVRAFAFDNIEPYSGEVASRVQQLVYGDVLRSRGNEPYILDTPFHLLLAYFIFAPLSDPNLARAIFTAILELTLIPLALFSLRLTEWEAPRTFVFAFLFAGVFGFYSIRSIVEASPVILLGLLYAGILLCLRMEADELAGILIAFSLYSWEVGGLFLLLILLRVRAERRMAVFAGAAMITIVLLLVSFLLYPDWVIPFLRAGMNNLRADFGYTVFKAVEMLYPAHGLIVAQILSGLLVVLVIFENSRARHAGPRHFYWLLCLALAASPLLGFRTEMEHLSVLVIPFALILSVAYDRWGRSAAVVPWLVLFFGAVAPWLIYEFADRVANEILFLYFPLFNIIGLYWVRWWAIRPARTWVDYAHAK